MATVLHLGAGCPLIDGGVWWFLRHHSTCNNGVGTAQMELEENSWRQLADRAREIPPETWMQVLFVAAAIVVVFSVALVVRALLRHRRRTSENAAPEIIVDLSQQAQRGPSRDITPLTFYSLPVRLVIAVVAPLGRGGELPPSDGTRKLFDDLLPGLGGVIKSHGTEVIRWPEVLSSEGFARRFFATVRLPGNRGKESPWCSVAGRFESDGNLYMAGLTLCAASDNSLGEFTVDRPNGWLEMLSIRR